MTLLIRRRSLFLFTLVVTLAVLALAAYEYRVVSGVLSGEIDGKLARERILILSIVFSASVLGVAIAVIAGAVMFSSILEKLVGMNRMTGFAPELALNKLGEVGQKISLLYRQASELSAKKSRKIGGLSSLVEHLMSESSSLILVTDSGGQVVYASKGLVDRLESPRAEIIGTALETLVPEGDVATAVQSVRRSRTPAAVQAFKSELIINPIFSADGEVHYLAIEVPRPATDRIREDVLSGSTNAPAPAARRDRRSVLPKLFKRRGGG